MAKKTKEERETEFIDAVEQVLGFPLLPWQRRLMLEIRTNSLAGRSVRITKTELSKWRKF